MRCNDVQLKRLIAADESSAEFDTTVRHVETCTYCQQRLEDLSGDYDFRNEVRETLSEGDETFPYRESVGSSVVVSIEAGLDDEFSAECEPVSLDFLSPPSHPEMLGRIGRYEVERMIGSGGMGIVLKGFDTELHRVVAIKVLKPHLAHNGAARHRFAREAQSAAAVVHEHVIPIHDVQSDSEMPFLVMQYVPGQSLQARVDERGPLEPKEVLRIARQVAAGLSAAHAQGLVHRDVKPANILMEESVERVLISDFGLARTVDDATLTKTGIVAGTPHYMSPEQASGRAIDSRSDLFSLGSVLYFMCTGRPPFRAEHAMAILNRICHEDHRPVDEVNSDIPPELADTIDRLLSKDANHRFRTAQEVEQHLETLLSRMQAGRRSYRLGWKRGWQRWRPTVMTGLRNMAIVTACVLVGIGLSQRYLPVNVVIDDNRPARGLPPNRTDKPSASSDSADVRNGSPLQNVPPLPVDRQAVQPSEIPQDKAVVQFLRDLDLLNADVRDLETRWSRIDQTILIDNASDSAWYLELEKVKAELQTMDQVGESGNKETQTERTNSPERIKK